MDPTTATELIESWLGEHVEANPALRSIEREPKEQRWIVRLEGEEKDIVAVWFTLGQRTIRVESQVTPAPEEDHAAVYEYVLRRNDGAFGWCWSIGEEDALYVRGRFSLLTLDHEELDRILGSVYAEVEQSFRPILRVGFATRLARSKA